MAWLYLFAAGLLEIGWAVGLKYTDGFTRPLPSLLTGLSMVASVVLRGTALRTLPVGTAYAIWVGIGASLTVVYAMATGAEPVSTLKVLFLLMIVGGVVGLKLVA